MVLIFIFHKTFSDVFIRYDLLNKKLGSIGYLRTTTQNELIELISKQVEMEICNE